MKFGCGHDNVYLSNCQYTAIYVQIHVVYFFFICVEKKL